MSKDFNFPAFIAHFGRIIDSHIEQGRMRGMDINKLHPDWLSDRASFYCSILYIVREEEGIEDMQSFCEIAFERNLDIVSRDVEYIEDSQWLEGESADIQKLITSQYGNALKYERAPSCYRGALSYENPDAATPASVMPESDLLGAEKENHSATD